jgi:hypothetical protein
MSIGRRIFREYAKSKGKEASEFVEVKQDWLDVILITKDKEGYEEKLYLDTLEMIYWLIKNKKIK